MVYEDKKYLVEYFPIEGGLLSIEDKATGDSFMVGMRSTLSGRCIVRGQFKDSVRTHGIERTVQTFRKLAIAA